MLYVGYSLVIDNIDAYYIVLYFLVNLNIS